MHAYRGTSLSRFAGYNFSSWSSPVRYSFALPSENNKNMQGRQNDRKPTKTRLWSREGYSGFSRRFWRRVCFFFTALPSFRTHHPMRRPVSSTAVFHFWTFDDFWFPLLSSCQLNNTFVWPDIGLKRDTELRSAVSCFGGLIKIADEPAGTGSLALAGNCTLRIIIFHLLRTYYLYSRYTLFLF